MKPSNKSIVSQFQKQERGETRPKLIKKLDTLFSKYMINKYKKCFKCGGLKSLGVSHYFSRRYIGTRWDEDNCDVACWGDHYYRLEHFKAPGEWYHKYMEKKLGKLRFENLQFRAHSSTKIRTDELKILLQQFEKGNFI